MGRFAVAWRAWAARGGRVGGGRREREEKQGTYFPVYPNLRKAQRLRARGGIDRNQRKRERGESRGGNKS